MLQTPHVHALIVGHGEIELGLNWELPACCLAFIMSEGPCRLLEGTVTDIPAWLSTLHAKILTCQAGCSCLCNSGSAIMSKTSWISGHLPKGVFMSGSKSRTKTCSWGGYKSQWEVTSMFCLPNCLCVFWPIDSLFSASTCNHSEAL